MLLAPVALQRPGDLGLAGLDAPLAMAGQLHRIAHAGHNVAHDGLPGHAHHVGQHFRELNVHLHQRLLHALAQYFNIAPGQFIMLLMLFAI